jgi:hypothetical protein
MKLSSILVICSGLINIWIAGISYYFALTSYLDNWLYGAGWQLIIGVMFTIVSIGSFLSWKDSDRTKSTVGGIALMMVALVELLFSIPFLFFAFAGGYISLLEYGIPLFFASIFLLVSSILKWRETKHRRMKEQKT